MNKAKNRQEEDDDISYVRLSVDLITKREFEIKLVKPNPICVSVRSGLQNRDYFINCELCHRF